MPPSRLLRSPLLWLGLPGLLFLIWAWVSSIPTARTLIIGYGDRAVRLSSGAGFIGVAAGVDIDAFMHPDPTLGWWYSTETMRTADRPSGEDLRHYSTTPFSENWTMETSYRVLTVLYLIFWLLGLWLRGWVAEKAIAARKPDVPRGTPTLTPSDPKSPPKP